MGELALCSPLVVAQSRVEHDSAVQLGGRSLVSADGFFSGRVGTLVRFMVDGKELAVSGLTFPYLPPVDSAAGLQLMAASESVGQPAPVAHEVCALQMFQARVNRSK